jgi:glycosyltransferase involved in cell wall biosynthesis
VKPIRVVHVITRLILGGAQENTLLTVEGLDRMPEYEVTLISGPALGPEGELIARARRNNVNLIIVPQMQRAIHPVRDAITLAKLVRLYRRLNPHIVHTHSSKAGILGRVAARMAGVPIIIHTIHGLPFHPYETGLNNLLYKRLERWAARWSQKIITVADAMRDQAVAAGVAGPEKFVTIYSGMEVDTFLAADQRREAARRALGIAADEVVIGKIARLFELKGHEYVIAAAPKILHEFPKARFLFVGDGILRQKLQEQAARLGVAERIIFAGLVDPSRIPEMLGAMDLVVHASLREGLARVLPQALLAGRPVVSYDIDGAREVVRDGVTGYLVKPQAVDELADAVLKMLRDPAKARAMAMKGRELFANPFRAEIMVKRISALYRELLSRASSR